MKKAQTIISHLLNKPTFQNAVKAECLDKLISTLPDNITKYISFCYIKNDNLFIAVTHPGIKMELYYKCNLLKSILTVLKKEQSKCQSLHFSDIKIFVSDKNVKKEDESTIPRYYEHADANFKNLAQDEELKEKFEQIRKEIINNKND